MRRPASRRLKADEFQVKWEVLDDQPQTLLAEIERTTGTKTLPVAGGRRPSRPIPCVPKPST